MAIGLMVGKTALRQSRGETMEHENVIINERELVTDRYREGCNHAAYRQGFSGRGYVPLIAVDRSAKECQNVFWSRIWDREYPLFDFGEG